MNQNSRRPCCSTRLGWYNRNILLGKKGDKGSGKESIVVNFETNVNTSVSVVALSRRRVAVITHNVISWKVWTCRDRKARLAVGTIFSNGLALADESSPAQVKLVYESIETKHHDGRGEAEKTDKKL